MDIVNNNWYIQIISRKYIGSLKSLLFKPRYSQDNMGTNQAGVQGRCRVLRGAQGHRPFVVLPGSRDCDLAHTREQLGQSGDRGFKSEIRKTNLC